VAQSYGDYHVAPLELKCHMSCVRLPTNLDDKYRFTWICSGIMDWATLGSNRPGFKTGSRIWSL